MWRRLTVLLERGRDGLKRSQSDQKERRSADFTKRRDGLQHRLRSVEQGKKRRGVSWDRKEGGRRRATERHSEELAELCKREKGWPWQVGFFFWVGGRSCSGERKKKKGGGGYL